MRARLTIAALGMALLPCLADPAMAQEEKEWGYNKGFYFKTGQFELKISTRTQFRFTETDFDDTSASEDRGEFTLPRTRLRLDGFAYYPWLKYKVQYDFTGQTYSTATSVTVPADDGTNPETVSLSNLRGPDLRDLYLDIARSPRYSVRLGQFKAPFGMQEQTSSGDQEFVDRSVISDGQSGALTGFAPSRQIGAMLFGNSFEKRFGYMAGIFNGNSRNARQNDNDRYLYAVRVNFDPSGEYKLSESAIDHPTKVNWTIGAACMVNAIDAAGDLTDTSTELFFGLKYKRLFVLADAYARSEEELAGPDTDAEGFIAQVGYFFVPRKLEVAVRWAQGDRNTDASDDKLTETRIGFGYYISKHDLKFQADYGQVENEASATDEKTNFFRAQWQIVF